MSKEQFNPNGYFNQDQIDSLRLEVENISPKEREEVLRVAQKLNASILEAYSEYIGYSENPEQILQRLVFTKSTDTISRLRGLWLGFKKEESNLAGLTLHPDKFSILWFKNKESFPDIKEYIEKNKKKFLKKYENLEKAQDDMVDAYMHNVIVHELIHLYSPSLELPLRFEEAGAYFYAYHLIKSIDVVFVSLNEPNDTKLRNLYQKLINKYGNDVHKLFFGQEVDEKIRNSIFEEIQKRKFKKVLL